MNKNEIQKDTEWLGTVQRHDTDLISAIEDGTACNTFQPITGLSNKIVIIEIEEVEYVIVDFSGSETVITRRDPKWVEIETKERREKKLEIEKIFNDYLFPILETECEGHPLIRNFMIPNGRGKRCLAFHCSSKAELHILNRTLQAVEKRFCDMQAPYRKVGKEFLSSKIEYSVPYGNIYAFFPGW